MNKTIVLSFAVAAVALALSGCASMSSDWHPIVDSYADKNAYRIQQDQAECQALLKQAGGTFTEAMKGAGVGGLVGAGAGAAIGAVIGNPAAGAALGAAAGGIGGGAYNGITADADYQSKFKSCMRGRGHNVL